MLHPAISLQFTTML